MTWLFLRQTTHISLRTSFTPSPHTQSFLISPQTFTQVPCTWLWEINKKNSKKQTKNQTSKQTNNFDKEYKQETFVFRVSLKFYVLKIGADFIVSTIMEKVKWCCSLSGGSGQWARDHGEAREQPVLGREPQWSAHHEGQRVLGRVLHGG